MIFPGVIFPKTSMSTVVSTCVVVPCVISSVPVFDQAWVLCDNSTWYTTEDLYKKKQQMNNYIKEFVDPSVQHVYLEYITHAYTPSIHLQWNTKTKCCFIMTLISKCPRTLTKVFDSLDDAKKIAVEMSKL